MKTVNFAADLPFILSTAWVRNGNGWQYYFQYCCLSPSVWPSPRLQSFAIAASFEESFGTPAIFSGSIVALVIGLIIFGGIKRLVHVAEFIVPVMAIGYIICALYIIGINLSDVPETLLLIVRSAFGLEETIAGGIGAALSWGCKTRPVLKRGRTRQRPQRGSDGRSRSPGRTRDRTVTQCLHRHHLLLCSCTALIILLSGTYVPGSEEGGVTLTQQALGAHLGVYAGWFVSIALFFFSFTTIMYNYFLGENALDYLFKHRTSVFTGFRWLTAGTYYLGFDAKPRNGIQLRRPDHGSAGRRLTCLRWACYFPGGGRCSKTMTTSWLPEPKHPGLDKTRFTDMDLDEEVW